jgi:hypothetical protein
MNHDVAVYREGRSYRVEPGRLLVHPDDTITLWTVDAGPVTVILPPGIVGESHLIPLGGHNPRHGTVTVPPGMSAACYEYAVHVDDQHVFAEGGSQPKIIVLE